MTIEEKMRPTGSSSLSLSKDMKNIRSKNKIAESHVEKEQMFELGLHLDSAKTPIIYIKSREEKRICELIARTYCIAKYKEGIPKYSKDLFVWDLINGITMQTFIEREGLEPKEIKENAERNFKVYKKGTSEEINDENLHKNPKFILPLIDQYEALHNKGTVFILNGFHDDFNDPESKRILKQWLEGYQFSDVNKKAIIFISPCLPIIDGQERFPTDLKDDILYLNWVLPPQPVVKKYLRICLQNLEDQLKSHKISRKYYEENPDILKVNIDDLARTFSGLLIREIESALAYVYNKCKRIDIQECLERRKFILTKNNEGLRLSQGEKPENYAGLDIARTGKNQTLLEHLESMRFSLKYPKITIGCNLLLGPSGTGKSKFGKLVAGYLGLPCIEYTMKYSKYVGDMPNEIVKLHNFAEAFHPCVVVVNEAEKLLGINSHIEDGGNQSQVVGEFLKLLENKPRDAIFILTVNSITNLKPEMLNAHRVDKIIFMDYPTLPIRKSILEIVEREMGFDPAMLSNLLFAKRTKWFSHSEVRSVIIQTLQYNRYKLTDEVILKTINNMKDNIQYLAFNETIKPLRQDAVKNGFVPKEMLDNIDYFYEKEKVKQSGQSILLDLTEI